MQRYLTADSIANTMRMTRTQFQGAFLLVEGDTDQRFFKRFIRTDMCQIKASFGKENALAIMTILERDHFPGVLALLDADFMVLEQTIPTSSNILLTDAHDMEMLLLRSAALDKVLIEFGAEEKIASFIQRKGKDVRTILLEYSAYVGYLRWYSIQASLDLKFEDLDFSKFIHRDDLEINILGMIKTVKNHSQKHNLSENDIHQHIQQVAAQGHDLYHVCCGHDVMALLQLGLRKVWGSHNTNNLSVDLLERILRVAFEEVHFQATQLYQDIHRWEQAHVPYVIVK